MLGIQRFFVPLPTVRYSCPGFDNTYCCIDWIAFCEDGIQACQFAIVLVLGLKFPSTKHCCTYVAVGLVGRCLVWQLNSGSQNMVHANTCHNYKQTRVGLHCASEPGGPCFVASHEGGLCSPFCDQRELDCPHKNGCMIILSDCWWCSFFIWDVFLLLVIVGREHEKRIDLKRKCKKLRGY